MNRTIDSVRKTNYLTRGDVDPEVIVTVSEVADEEMSTANGNKETKAVVYFKELEKGLVLNWTNAQLIANFLGSRNMDDWPGGQVTLYDDPTISFAGKVTGGIRVKAAPKSAPPTQLEDPNDPLPWGEEAAAS